MSAMGGKRTFHEIPFDWSEKGGLLTCMWNWRDTLFARTVLGFVFAALVLFAWAVGLIRL